MHREEVIQTILEHKNDLKKFGVESLALFGSVARDEATTSSDVDILVEFSRPPRFRDYFGLNEFLEDILKVRVDLVQAEAMRPSIAAKARAESVRVA